MLTYLPAQIFKRGQCDYRNTFTSPERTYEADVPYSLRYMLDTEVSKGDVALLLLVIITLPLGIRPLLAQDTSTEI